MIPIDILFYYLEGSFPFFYLLDVIYTTVLYCAVKEIILKSWFSLKKVAIVIKEP